MWPSWSWLGYSVRFKPDGIITKQPNFNKDRTVQTILNGLLNQRCYLVGVPNTGLTKRHACDTKYAIYPRELLELAAG